MKDKNEWPDDNAQARNTPIPMDEFEEIAQINAGINKNIVNYSKVTGGEEPNGLIRLAANVITGFIITIIALGLIWVIISIAFAIANLIGAI